MVKLSSDHPGRIKVTFAYSPVIVARLKTVTLHTFGHCLATLLLETNYDMRTVKELLEHNDVLTTIAISGMDCRIGV
jgi:site-specific recombinase XerC